MKKILVPVVYVLMVACLVMGCAGKYADVKKVNTRFAAITQAYVDKLEKADDAKAVARAMNSYADELERVWPQMQKLSEKYPELKDQKNLPKGLEASQKEAGAVGQKMAGTFMKVMPYIRDPEVKKAQDRLAAVMTNK